MVPGGGVQMSRIWFLAAPEGETEKMGKLRNYKAESNKACSEEELIISDIWVALRGAILTSTVGGMGRDVPT